MKLALLVTTLSSVAEAERMAQQLVERRLAACVQMKEITSVYRWEGEIQTEEEVRLTFKTTQGKIQALKRAVAEMHSYDEPEILVLPVAEASEGYAAWVEKETRADC
jgi:periplasmic divalent cation tolerance protein